MLEQDHSLGARVWRQALDDAEDPDELDLLDAILDAILDDPKFQADLKEALMTRKDDAPVVRTGQGEYTRDWPAPAGERYEEACGSAAMLGLVMLVTAFLAGLVLGAVLL